MKTENELIESMFEDIEDLAKKFDFMITDLHDIKGGAQARINYIYHRKALWEINEKMKAILGKNPMKRKAHV